MNESECPITDLQHVASNMHQEAARRGHEIIALPHLILGLLTDEHNLACRRLIQLGCDLDELRQAIEKHLTPGDKTVGDACLLLHRDTERALQGAMLEANGLTRDIDDAELLAFFQSPEQERNIPTSLDLLLAILRDEENFMTKLLNTNHIDYTKVKKSKN